MLDDASIGAFVNVTDGDLDKVADEIATLRAHGLDHVEVWLEYQPPPRELDALTRLLDGWVRIMHGPFVGMSLSTDWEALAAISLERCHRAIEAAGVLSCEVVTLHGGTYGDFTPHETALERLSARVARFTRISHPVVTIENMPARGGATREAVTAVEDLDALRDRIPTLKLTLDVGHCLQNGEDPAAVADRHVNHIADIHLHDGVAGGRAHAALGTGDLDVAELVRLLDARAYRGFISIETLTGDDLTASLETLAALDVKPGRGSPRVHGGMSRAA